ncbi:hypothetical protein L2755_04530 [Shewanella abyssi]|uniref:hypothetical protein n=1 Tax=Shewanella abyssi TaxID=311789 RepID=UPI00200D3C32|nr:hypothetical protein [Shewanella abyssi]MCL1048895.1 hypothetical protein [Shewanella abyssi]
MLNLSVVPIMPILGMLTANLNELIRGEAIQWHPKLTIGIKTFNVAITAFAIIWFALLVTAIDVSELGGIIAGVEVLVLFLAGISFYSLVSLPKFIHRTIQLWLYRFALPIMLIGSFWVIQYG